MIRGERLNGYTHLTGTVLAAAGCAQLIALAASRNDPTRLLSFTIYGATLFLMYLSSTAYHSTRGRTKDILRTCDFCAIYLLIAGSYTPVGLLLLRGGWRVVVLAIVWSGAAAAIVLKLFWVRSPKWLAAAIAIPLGWVGVVVLPQVADRAGLAACLLLVAGGVAYTAGGLVYAFRRPDPVPSVFGYHELFHALVLVAVGLQYGCIAFYVLPHG